MPRYPSFPGIWISEATVFTTSRSGVTISSWMVSAMGPFLLSALGDGLHLFGCLEHFFDRALHVESLLGNIIVLAFDDLLEAADGVGNFHVASLHAGELLGHEERLREEFLHLAGAGHGQLVVFAQLFDTENGDDILQVFVALQNPLYALCDIVVLLSDDMRIEDA